MEGFISLSLLSLKANGVYLRLLRMGQQAVWLVLQLEVQVQIKPRDSQMTARAQVLLHAWLCWPIFYLGTFASDFFLFFLFCLSYSKCGLRMCRVVIVNLT